MSSAVRKPRILIVGGGFGGLYAARALGNAEAEVTLLDRTNHHLFQPLLYQVATAMLAPTDITAPIRWLLRHQRNTTVLLANVTSVDTTARVVTSETGRTFTYDFLIVACGARHAYFSHPEWEQCAPGLKSIDDAIELRRRILLAFEHAELSEAHAEAKANLTFVIVGGGPTGVELAGMIPSIAKDSLARDFRNISTESVRVMLVEGGNRILPSYPAGLSARAAADLGEMGVEIRTGSFVTAIDERSVHIGDERIETCTVIWAAGNAASPIGKMLGTEVDAAGRVRVQPDLSISGHPDVFAIGDMVAVECGGKPVPGVAPAAMQMGERAARNVLRAMRGQKTEPFVYRNKGDLATIGRHRAIADFGKLQVTGTLAWWFWLLLHIMYLAGFRNRISVLVEWGYSYFTYQRGARLISPRE